MIYKYEVIVFIMLLRARLSETSMGMLMFHVIRENCNISISD